MFAWLKKLFNPNKGLGLIPQPMDSRDKPYRMSGSTVFKGVDLSSKMGEVLNQGRSNACTAFAVSKLFTYVLKYKKNITSWDIDISRLFLWYNCRNDEGNSQKNVGVILRNVFKNIQKHGFVRDKVWTMSQNWYDRPTPKVYLEGEMFKLYLKTIKGYYSMSRTHKNFLLQIDNCLTNEIPIVFGFPIYDELAKANSKNYVIDTCTGTNRGYHAMIIVGNNKEGYVKVMNSWGTSRGRRGFIYLNKELLKQYAIDVWTLK